jgi:hypothetical protein
MAEYLIRQIALRGSALRYVSPLRCVLAPIEPMYLILHPGKFDAFDNGQLVRDFGRNDIRRLFYRAIPKTKIVSNEAKGCKTKIQRTAQ